MANANATQYKCPSCGSTLKFIPSEGKLGCASCGNRFDVEAMDEYSKQSDSTGEFNWGMFKGAKENAQQMENTSVYVCQSCGAAIETDGVTAAMACPYCGNNVILDDKLEGGLKPNAIIPFKIYPKDLPDIINKFCKKKKLLPKGFFEENKIGKLQGVYVPFWLYNCHIDGEITLNAQKVRFYREGKYDCTETAHFLLTRDGEMAFTHIPVDASVRMDNDLMDSIEPFDFSELEEFDKGYLSGFLADRFDTDPDSEIKRASDRMRKSAEQAFSETTPGYTGVSIRSNNVQCDKASLKYALLPVYLLNCTYKDKNYRYAINGQTGKVVGELPISKTRMLAWFGGVGGGVFVAVFLILMFLMGGAV